MFVFAKKFLQLSFLRFYYKNTSTTPTKSPKRMTYFVGHCSHASGMYESLLFLSHLDVIARLLLVEPKKKKYLVELEHEKKYLGDQSRPPNDDR